MLNVVSGFGPEVGRALVTHPKVRKVAFTGSTETGRQVMADAAGHLARLSLELGGNDAAILLDDVDLSEQAIERLVTGAFMHTGQICIDIKRIYVHESRYDELVDKLRAAVDQIVVGDGTRPEVTMGPINNSRQYDKVTKLLAETKQAADVVQLGSYAEGTDVADGYFMLPHLVLDPSDDLKVVATEQMSPILPIMKFSTDDEAVARANGTEYGLALVGVVGRRGPRLRSCRPDGSRHDIRQRTQHLRAASQTDRSAAPSRAVAATRCPPKRSTATPSCSRSPTPISDNRIEKGEPACPLSRR